jgi:hypothetical protein
MKTEKREDPISYSMIIKAMVSREAVKTQTVMKNSNCRFMKSKELKRKDRALFIKWNKEMRKQGKLILLHTY